MSTTTTGLSGTYSADPVHSSVGFALRVQGVAASSDTSWSGFENG